MTNTLFGNSATNEQAAQFVRQQVEKYPLLAVAGAVAAGFVLGSTEENSPNQRRLPGGAEARRMLQGAAMAAVTGLVRQALRQQPGSSGGATAPMQSPRSSEQHYSQAEGRHFNPNAPFAPQPQPAAPQQTSTAPNNSWNTGAGEAALGFDSPPITSSDISNPETEGVEHLEPYYPPGGAPDGGMRRRYDKE
ncbi:MAG: hypothetical protein MUD01_05190 [Chloroflexaceae bacterium]|jgi:hypothetical protein|nr:hypothetical protein [Chloroflexaceae bacterium]